MSRKKFEFILSASTTGFNSVNKAQRGLQAFNREIGNGSKMMGVLHAQIGAVAGAYLGFNALSNTAAIIKDANSSIFQLESSLLAANREFDDVGTMKTWGNTIDDLSGKLRIYSKADLQKAAAKTVDMTKRLGLSEKQMRKVISATADLSAGKTTLEGGIERVTSALRGEAEASEYLGLTLNETYVKAWYEASGAMQGAWKDLDDLQKAQVRYQVFLEQALPLQGKSAKSIETLAGSWALVTARIHDSINANEDMTEVVADLAKYLAENSDELGEMATAVAQAAASTAKWVIENRELVVTLGKWAVGLLLVHKGLTILTALFRGVQAASLAMTGTSVLVWLGKLRVLLAGVTLGMGATFLASAGLAAGVVAGVMLMVTALVEESQILKENEELVKQNAAARSELASKFKEISDATGVTVTSMKELDQAVADGTLRFDEATGKWVRDYMVIADAASESANKQKKVTADQLDAMRAEYKKYAAEIKRIQDEISGRERSLAEELRAMSRSGMSDLKAWKDRKKEAQEYEAAARKAAEAGDFDNAVKMADKAKDAYKDLNHEVKSGDAVLVTQNAALKTSMQGVRSSGELAIEILKKQQKAAAEAADELVAASGFEDLSEGMNKAEKQWEKNWRMMKDATMDELDAVERRIVEVSKDRYATIYVNTVQQKANGGPVLGFATGGSVMQKFQRLANPYITRGSGVRDDVPALLKKNEFVQPDWSVAKYGLRFMEAVRRGVFPVEMARGFNQGGHVLPGVAPAGIGSLGGSSGGVIHNNNFNISGPVPAATQKNARDLAKMVLVEWDKMHRRQS